MINLEKSAKETPLRVATGLAMAEGFTGDGRPVDIWVFETDEGEEFAFSLHRDTRIHAMKRLDAYREKLKP